MSNRAAIVCVVATVFVALVATTAPAAAGDITGMIWTPTGTAFSEMVIGATQTGSLGGYGLAWSWAAAPVGWYSITGLAAGTYSLGYGEKDEWNRYLKWGVVVGAGSTSLSRTIEYQNYGAGRLWDGNRVPYWAQSFAATGTSIISVSIDCALEFGPDTTVTIHENDPWGAQIGPARVIPTDIANPSAVFWSAGQVPTVPGRIYCAKFSAASGIMPFMYQTKIQNSNIYPEGRTWRNGTLSQYPFKTVIGQDDDGIITTVSTRKAKLPGSAYLPGSIIGQTFTARGSSVLYVNVMAGNTNGVLKVSIHDGVGAGGDGGTQIGQAKYIKVDNWNHRCLAVWAPGEAPVQAGHVYYVKFVRPDSQVFTLWHANNDDYPGGTAYLGGIAQTNDLSITIAEEEFSGSAAMPRIAVSDPVVTRYADSAVVAWTSSLPSTTSYVEFGADTPYSNIEYDHGATSHSVTLNGLAPNTQYHFRVVSTASGCRDGVSRDFVFVTEPLGANLLANPGFETGAVGPWVKFGVGDIGIRSGDYFGCKKHGGVYFQGGASNGGQALGGCYQRVAVAPGRPVSARAWIWTWQIDQLHGTKPYIVCGRIGIDPAGGTNPDAGTVVWSPYVVAQRRFGDNTGTWTEVWTTAVPTGNYATVFVRSGADNALTWTVFGHDDVVLTQEPPLTALNRISDAAAKPDGTLVQVAGKPVTATSAQIGANYVEESDRTSGIRVESLDTFEIGRVVTLSGYLGTRSTGERYIYGARKLLDVAGDPVRSMATRVSDVGGVTPSKIGLLMRVAGRVTLTGEDYFFINDGSVSGSGLRVQSNSLSTPPAADEFVAVTGIIELVGTAPNGRVAIRPRQQSDVRVF